MEPLSRITAATVDVLGALIDGGESVWGLQVIKATGRPPGSVYPILDRLERAGWVTSHWEVESERSGPRRRFYSLTAVGADAARATVADFAARAAHGSAAAAVGGRTGVRTGARPVAPMLRPNGAPA